MKSTTPNPALQPTAQQRRCAPLLSGGLSFVVRRHRRFLLGVGILLPEMRNGDNWQLFVRSREL